MEGQSEVILILIGSTFIILVLIGLSMFALITNQKRKFRHTQHVSQLEFNYSQELLKVQIETQNQTMEAISRELHDNVGALLSIALSMIKSPLQHPHKLKEMEAELGPLLEEVMTILKDISVSMNPVQLEELGLRKSIIRELEKVKSTKALEVETINKGEEFIIDPAKRLVIFRIFQEALNNVLKHANANHIKVMIEYQEQRIKLLLIDNGQGFEMNETLNDQAGLKNMYHRSKLIGANLKIASSKSNGTQVELTFEGLNSSGLPD